MKYKNILLIDEDLEDLEIFNSALEKVSNEINCVSLTNAKEALIKLNEKELDPDVIFLDLNMPVMGGREFLKKIKESENLKSIPVIIFSTSSNSGTIIETKELGAIDFITKPNRFDDLVTILKSSI